MQTGPERWGERTSQTGQSLGPNGLPANRNLRLTNEAIAELNSRVRSNPSLMQFTTQAAGRVIGGELSNMNGGLGAEAVASARLVSMVNSVAKPSETLLEPVRFSGEELKYLIRMSVERLSNRSFVNATRMTTLTGFVYDMDKYMCQACAFNTTSRLLFGEHLRCHAFKMPYLCGECGSKTILKNIPSHYCHKHRNCEPSVCAMATPLVDEIMQKLGPTAPYSVNKVDVQPNRQNAVPTCSASSFENIRPGGSGPVRTGHRSNFSLVDLTRDDEGLLQALINETNQQNLDMLAANCDYKDGVYMCNLCKFSTHRPFEIFEHVIADVQRWKCCCTACMSSDPRSCSVVKAAAAKLIRREQEAIGETGDFPPTMPITPIVIAPLGNHIAPDQYNVAVSQPAVVSDVPWQSPPTGSHSAANMQSRPPPCYYQTLVSTGRALPFTSEDVGSPPLYIQHARAASTASSAYQEASTTTIHWRPSQITSTESVSSNIPVRLRRQVLRIDSPAASRVNAPSTNLSTQRPTHVASSSFQPTRVVRITAAPTRPPPASEQSFPRPSAAPVSSTPLPEWLRPTLQELTVNLSREANKEKQLETETAVTSQAANGGSGQKQAAVAGSPAVRPTLNNTSGNMQDKGYPIVIELSDSSEDGQLEDTTVPPIPVPQSVPEKECNEESVTETATADSSTRKQTETSPNKRRTSDDQLGNIHRKKAFSKHKSSVRLAQVKRKKIAESDKHGNDSVPTGSAEEDVDKGNFFRCSIPNCGRSYCDPENLKTHIKRCHASLKIYSCPYCCCLWSDYNLLVDHILVHIGSKPYRCVQCDICFDTNIKLRNHFDDSHHVNMFFKCMVDGCEYDSKLWTEFKVHVSCCHPAEEAYTCFACGANFTNRTTYLRHLELGMETLICCAYCSMKSKLRFSIIRHLGSVHQGLAKKVTVHTEIKCGKGSKPTLQKFSAIEARQVLRRSTHEKTTIETPPVLQQSSHEKTAIETPPVLRRCTHCDFVDADKILVDAHVESHKSKRDLELTFSCTFCTFGSNNMHEYMQHLAYHRGKVTQKLRYFRCPYCLFTSNQMALVEKHLDKKHREEPFKFEVQQKDVTTNGQVTGASPDVGHDGSPGRQKRTCAVVTQGGSNKKPQASCDPVSSNKRPKRVSTGPVMHKRLVILLERCTVPTTTPDTLTSQTRAKRKISTGEDCDDDKGLNRRHTKKSRTSRQTGVVKKTAGDQSEAVQSSTRACRLDHSVASLIDEYGVGDKEPMLSEDDDVEEEDSYWREMIRKSVSPEEKNAVQTSPSVLHKMHRDDSSSGVSVGECNVNEGEPVSENEDAYWRNIIQKKTNLDVVATEEKIVLLDEEDEDTYWIDVVKNSKHGKQSEGPRESCQSTTVRRSGRARLVASKSAGATGNRVSRDVGDIPMLSGGDFIRPQPATPGSSSSLTIAKYHCTSCEFLCRDLRLFNEHVRSSHEDSGSLASLVMTMTGDGTVTTERSSHKQATAAAMGQTAGLAAGSTTTPDAVVNNEDDKMKYHCNLCSIDCQDWEMFELHMTDVHGYSVIKTDTTSPFQDIVAVPIKKPVDRRKFSCNACSFSTHFKFNLKKHSVTHINRPHLQPTSSPRKGTSPRKRNIETRSKSDAKSSDTSQLVEPILSRNSGKIELRSRVKDAPVGDNDTGGAGDDGNTDHIHQVSFIKQVHADRLYKCKKCSYANDRIDRVERHVLRSHLYLMPYKCPYCASDSSDYNALLRHVSDLHRKKPTCVIYRVTGAPKCRKLVRRYIVDSTTQNAHDGRATSFILKSSKSNTSESVDSDKRIQKGAGSDKNGTTKVNDGVCGDNKGQDDSDVKELSKQLPCRKSSTSVLLWKCKTCPDRVSMLKEMQQHLLSQHLSLKPYKCGACPFSAVRTEMVDEHIRHTHSVEDHVVVLDMLVEKADSLRAMMVMVRRDAADSSNHQEHTPDQCQCGDEFDYELLRSISKNGNMVYDCDLCDYQASLKMSFIQHRKSHLQSTAVRCGYCDYRASSRHFLVNHISVAHPYRHVRYHLVHSNSTVASADLPCEGETLKDGKETMCVLSSLHTETTAPDKQRDTCIDMSDVVGAKKQEPTQSDEQDSSARRDTCTDIATTNDDVIESIGHPVEPPQGDCDYTVTLNIDCTDRLTEQKTDGSIEAKTDKSTEEKTDCSTEAKTDGSTGEKMDSTTEEKMNGLTEEKTDSLTKQKMDVVTEEMMDGATDEMTDGATEQTRDSSTEQKRDGLTEQTVEGSTEEKTNGSAEKKIDVATEEKMDGATEEKTGEKTDGSTEEKTDGLTGEKTDGSTEEKTNGLTGEKTDSLTEEKTDVATEETTDGVTDETTGGAKEEKTNGLAEETTDGATEGKTDGATEQNRDGLMEQTVDGSMEEKMNGLAEEKMDVATEEMADGATQEKTDCETEEKTDGATEEKTDCETEEKTDGATEEKTDCETEEKMHSSTEEKTDGSTEEKMDGLTEEKTDGSTEEKMDGSTEEKMDGLTEEKTDGATEQKRDGSTEQTVDGSMEENMNGLTEQKMDGSIDETTDGATEEIVDGGIDSQQMFMCVTCSMTMLLEQDIQHHIMVEHLEQKPYTCIYCDHSSADKRAVQLHTQKVHAGKPCSIIYETNGQLEAAIKENIVSVSSDTASQLLTPLVCNLCKKYTTRSMFQFLDHIAKEIKYTPYQCPYCSYSSIWRNAVKTHVAANHPQAQIRILLSEDVAQNRKILGLVKQCDSPHESDDKSDFNIFGDQTD